MQITLLTGTEAKRTLVKLIQKSSAIDIVVAWAGSNDVVQELLKHQNLLRHVVVGTHMFQTNPQVLRDLISISQARYMPPTGPLFHPKIYIFESEGGIAAFVGSHNLTFSAFEGKNIEAGVLMEGTSRDTVMRDLTAYSRSTWQGAKRIDENFLFSYEVQYLAKRKKIDALEKWQDVRQARTGAKKTTPLKLNWNDYIKRLKLAPEALHPRLDVAEGCQRLFMEKKSIADMTQLERRSIAGTLGKKEAEEADIHWTWFGSMFGAGDFKNLIRDHPNGISTALDEIPPIGNVSAANYEKFVQLFSEAFKGKTREGGVPTASRLLAMKRPDVFVCLNDRNRTDLCDALGVAPTTLKLESYWVRIIEPIQLAAWWNSEKPKNTLDTRIWNNRVAMLDCIYYKPKR